MALPVIPPFPPSMFPHAVTITHAVYPKGQTGGAARADGTTTTLNANVQSAGMDKVEMIPADEGQAAGGMRTFDVSFPADPGVVTNQTIEFGPIVLICLAPASPVFRGRAYRVRCVSRT
jgi:hypothetical protein